MSHQGPSCGKQFEQDCGPPPCNPCAPTMAMVSQPCSPPYQPGAPPAGYKYATPLKRSMSFLTTQELFSYKMIPAIGVAAYLGSSVGTIAHHETLEQWFGSEYTAIMIVDSMAVVSFMGTCCYMYGRRHIRHAGAFQKMIYPAFGSIFFNAASHFMWAYFNQLFKDQESFDYHWRILVGLLSGLTFLGLGRSYLHFIDHW